MSGARKARLSAGLRLAAASRYCGKVSQSQVMPAFSTSNGIASTFTRSRIAISRAAGRQGAMPTPQLPITTVVTPCQLDGVSRPVPADLRVVVGVRIDEPGRDHQAFGIDRSFRRSRRNDFPVPDADIHFLPGAPVPSITSAVPD